jgi:hypothetical protein
MNMCIYTYIYIYTYIGDPGDAYAYYMRQFKIDHSEANLKEKNRKNRRNSIEKERGVHIINVYIHNYTYSCIRTY